jgi:hypothetical protein
LQLAANDNRPVDVFNEKLHLKASTSLEKATSA